MNTPLRRVASVVLVMFVTLMASTTWIQFFQANKLNNDSRNARATYREYDRARGPIVVGGQAVAYSEEVDDAYGYQRTYTDGDLYAPVTGFFSIVSGRTEIEKAENAFLNGTDNELWFSQVRAMFTGEQLQGSSVELSIDPDVQRAAYDALGGQRGAVVAIEPSTGRILALVSTPSFDPNLLATHVKKDATDAYNALDAAAEQPLQNRAIRGNTYPPGSTFKLVTAAAALESGQYTKDTEVDAPVTWTLPGTRTDLVNYGGESCSPTGRSTLADTLTISCNTSFAMLGVQLGDEALLKQSEAFGFGQDLSVPMPVTPSRYPLNENDAQTALAAIGQASVRVTPLQMAMVSAAIANDGELMTPYTVDKISDSKLNTVQENKPKKFGDPISADTAEQLTQMMIDVVENGTGKPARIPGVQVAGKTGTAQDQKGQPPHAWFTGFAPADNPQVAVVVIVENGGTEGSEATGGEVAAPIAKSVMEAVING